MKCLFTMLRLLGVIYLGLSGGANAQTTEKCCEGKHFAFNTFFCFAYLIPQHFYIFALGACQVEGDGKYYSIVQQFGKFGPWNCGESCFPPEDYEMYLKFEPNLLPAPQNVTEVCKSFGYDIFLETATHGAGPVAITLDMYTKEQ